MGEDDMKRQRDEQNRRKLEEHLARIRRSGGVPPQEEQAQQEAQEKAEFESKWAAWKKMFGGFGRVYEIRDIPAPADPNDDYRLLGVSPDAGAAELRRAFLARAKQAHPDAGGDPERFRQLMAAYDRVRKD